MITLKVSGIFGKVMEIIARRLLREAILLANLVTDANIRGVARGAYETVLFKPDIRDLQPIVISFIALHSNRYRSVFGT